MVDEKGLNWEYIFSEFDGESLKKELQKVGLWSSVVKLKDEWCQSKETESSTKVQAMLSFFKFLINLGFPEPLDKRDFDTGIKTKDLEEYFAKVETLMQILIVILNQIGLHGGAQNTSDQPSSRGLLKAISCPLVVLCAIYMTSKETSKSVLSLKTNAKGLLDITCTGCHCNTVRELLSGCIEFTEAPEKIESASNKEHQLLFPTGLLSHIIVYLRPYLTKESWKKHSNYSYALIWCVEQVKHPFLGEHFPNILPALLFLVDDWQIENKIKGINCLNHVFRNVNAAELRWYGRADVVFEALKSLIYTNDPELVEVLHPCLLSVLKVVEDSPRKAKPGRKTNRCDGMFQVILNSMEFEGKFPMRRVYALHLKDFVEHMGITVLRHFKMLLKVVFSYLAVYDGPEEIVRINLLDCLQAVILHTWPRIPFHSQEILKSLLKLLVDVTDSRKSICPRALELLKSKTIICLILLRLCCGKPFEDQLMALKDGVDHEVTRQCLKKSLTSDIEFVEGAYRATKYAQEK